MHRLLQPLRPPGRADARDAKRPAHDCPDSRGVASGGLGRRLGSGRPGNVPAPRQRRALGNAQVHPGQQRVGIGPDRLPIRAVDALPLVRIAVHAQRDGAQGVPGSTTSSRPTTGEGEQPGTGLIAVPMTNVGAGWPCCPPRSAPAAPRGDRPRAQSEPRRPGHDNRQPRPEPPVLATRALPPSLRSPRRGRSFGRLLRFTLGHAPSQPPAQAVAAAWP